MPCLDHNKKGNAKGYSTADFKGTNTTLHRKVYCVANNVPLTQQAHINEWAQFLPIGPQLTAAVERMLTRVNLLKEEAACLSD